MNSTRPLVLLSLALTTAQAAAQDGAEPRRFRPLDVFELEYADDPQISPDGTQIVYVRTSNDIMKDRSRTKLWILKDGEHRPLTNGSDNESRPRWSPDGRRLLYASSRDGSFQLFVRWMDTGQVARLTSVTQAPGNFAWSPDGTRIAFTMLVPDPPKPFVKMPPKPKGAEWAEPARVITKLAYRSDGRGYLPDGYSHLFVLPADGGTPRQLTTGSFQHEGTPSWSPDGKSVVFSANRRPDAEYEPSNSDVYEIDVTTGKVRALTDQDGPDISPTVSPDGDKIAYVSYADRRQVYHVENLWVMNRDGSDKRLLTKDLDRSVGNPVWQGDSRHLFFQFDDHGRTKIGVTDLQGPPKVLVEDVGGTMLGRPYASGSFSASTEGWRLTYSGGDALSPADVMTVDSSGRRRHTDLNADLLGHKTLGAVEEVRFASSHDNREIQGWIVKPPDFDPQETYPLILEIHGGPCLNYGPRFAAEIQLFAAAGYVVLYTNPRGSTSYGEEFANLIHHNYPGQDYDDLMSGVDAVLAKGYVDKDRLFVTGGSGGGVLTSWIVGKTRRFRAAVVAKPVINWFSFALTSDGYARYWNYWFPGYPWDHVEHYMKRSPISLVGNVETPTMLLTGESDLRTPMAESEQFYQALKLRKIDTALVRIPGASHGITARPSHLIAKVAHILEWFGRHGAKAR